VFVTPVAIISVSAALNVKLTGIEIGAEGVDMREDIPVDELA